VNRFLIVIIILVIVNLQIAWAHPVTIYNLSNGLTVILSPSPDVESTCLLLYHKTGVRDDPPALKGISSLYQSLMYLGTKNLDPYERLMFIERHGGIGNRKIGYDNSIFYQVIPDSELNNALWLESERISSLSLSDRDLNMVKGSTYLRLSNLVNGNINVEANNWMKSLLFLGSDYAVPLYGNMEKLRSFPNSSVRNAYKNFKNPREILLVIAGKFNEKELRKFINNHFAGLPSAVAPTRKRNLPPPRIDTKFFSKNWLRDNIPVHFVMYGFRAPAKNNNEHLYFNFLRYHLLDSRISKIIEMVNRANRLNAAIHSEYTNHFDANALILKVSHPVRTELEKAKFIINNELEVLATKPIALSRLKEVKNLMELDFRKDMASLEKRSVILAEYFDLYGSLEFGGKSFEETYVNRIRKISSYDILNASKKYLAKSNQIILNVYKK